MTGTLSNNPNVYSGYLWLAGHNCWVSRQHVPTEWLRAYDEAFAAADASQDSDPDRHRVRGHWLDVCDEIREHVHPILDGPVLRASLAADDLRKAGDRAALDAFMARRPPRP